MISRQTGSNLIETKFKSHTFFHMGSHHRPLEGEAAAVCAGVLPCAYTHTHTHTYIYTHTHTNAHTHIHTPIHSLSLSLSLTHTHTHMRLDRTMRPWTGRQRPSAQASSLEGRTATQPHLVSGFGLRVEGLGFRVYD